MKKIVLFFAMMVLFVGGIFAQCDAPTNLQATPFWNRVNLSWESSLQAPGYVLDYGVQFEGRLGLGAAATYALGHRYPVDSLANHSGEKLTKLVFVPCENINYTIKIWQGGSYDGDETFDPGTLELTQIVTPSSLSLQNLNEIVLSSPITITGTDEIWVAIECTTTADQYPYGYGQGNAIDGYTNLLLYNNAWQTVGLSGGGNIGLVMQLIFQNTDISGFNIFRDGVQLNATLVTDHTYVDHTVLEETSYCYTVQSVCSSSTSSSDQACVTTPIQPNCGPVIGAGTSTTYYFPFNMYYNYSYSQEIFDADELGIQEGTIQSLTFEYFYTTNQMMNDITVYMANVSQSTFATTTDWIPSENLTQVYHGSVNCTNADSNRVTIDFDEAFEWDGHSNIVVAFLNNQGSYLGSSPCFYTHSTTGNKVLYISNDSSPYSIENPGTGTLSNTRNNMKFCFGPAPTCYRPTNLAVVERTGESITLSWCRHDENDSQWEVAYGLEGTPIDNCTSVTANDTTITLTVLLENEAYDIYVRTLCSGSDNSVWVKINARTLCSSIHVGIPYVENFVGYGEGIDAFPYCWHKIVNHDLAYPYISAASMTTGQMVLYSSPEDYSLIASQGIDLSAYQGGTLEFKYWIAQVSYNYYGRLDVGVMTDPEDLSTLTILKSYYPNDYEQMGYFQEESILLTETYTEPIYLAFMTPAAGSGNNIVIISHVSVDEAPSCVAPGNLTVSEVSGTSALISWDAAPYGAESYTLLYGEAGQAYASQEVTGTDYLLTGLTQGTAYDVMLFSNCATGNADTLELGFSTLAFLECMQPDTAGTAIVGTSATTSYLVPVNNYFKYSYTQQIYTADEIDSTHTPTVITGIAFQYSYSTAMSSKTGVKVYLAHRSSATFSSTSDWTPISEATLVYEGALNCVNGWNVFDFDNYFNYNGVDNLVLIVDDNSNGYNGTSYVFNTHTMSSNSTLYYMNDSSNPDPTNPPTGTLTTTRSNVKFYGCTNVQPMACPLPAVRVTETTEESVTIDILANGTETEWNVEYRAAGETSWSSEGSVSTTPYTIQNLSSDVNYEIRVQANCSTSDSSEWAYVNAYTPCVSVELPINENFENYTTDYMSCWTRKSNTAAVSPAISSSQAFSGTKSLFFSCPTAGNYAYAISPRLEDGTYMDSLYVSFSAYVATANHFIEVGLMEDPNDLNTFTLLGQASPSVVNTWELFDFISRGYTGDAHYVALRIPAWFADNIYIDDLFISYIPSCNHVTNIEVSNITPFTADVTWTAGGSETQWNYICGPVGTVDPEQDVPMPANENNITLSGLNSNTLYEIYIQSDCGDDGTSSWMHKTFRTDCAAMTALPYTENFDSYVGTTSTSTNVLPNCWARINNGTSYTGLPTIYATTTAAYSGNNGMYFYTYNSSSYSDLYAILPEIDTLQIPINTLQMQFMARPSSTSYPFVIEVGVMSDPTDTSTFVLVSTVTVNGSSYLPQEVYFDSFAGGGQYIALRVAKPTSGYNYGYIDDIVLDLIPDCSPVRNLTVSNIAGASAMISWESGHFGTVSSYSMEYSEAGQENWTTASDNISATSYMLGGLQPLTAYDVRVKTNCESGESDWITKTFYTRCLAGGEISIGNGASTNSYLPSYSLYNYSYTQQIFLASELNGQSMINSLSFEMGAVASQRNIQIYLMHTSATNSTSFLSATNAQLVYSGSQTMVTGWNTYNFNIPFQYNGTDNLALIIVDMTGSWTSGNNAKVHDGPSNCSRYIYQDGSAYSTSTIPTSGTNSTISQRLNVKFGGSCDETVTCIAPNMWLDNITINSVDVNWVAGYDENSWELEYVVAGDSNWISVPNVSGGLVTIDLLNSNTPYNVRMRSVCGVGEESSWVETSFRTACDVSTIPFSENFNTYGTGVNAFPTCWERINTYSATTNYPYISTVNIESGSGGSLYFYASATTYNIAVTPELDADLNTLEVSFYLGSATSISNQMIVGVMTDPMDVSTFVPVETVACSQTSNFEFFEVDLDSYTGDGKYVAFKTANATTGSYYLDNVNIYTIPTCKRPAEVDVVGTEDVTATVIWTERGTASQWLLEYGPEGFGFGSGAGTVVLVTGNPNYTITGLTPATTYEVCVRSLCDVGDTSDYAINYVTFATSACPSTDQCEYRFVCYDEYGDGWNDGYISVQQGGTTVAIVEAFDHAAGGTGSVDTVRVMLCDNMSTTFVWTSGNYDYEAGVVVLSPNGIEVYRQDNMSMIASPTLITFTTDCNEAPVPPTPCNIPTNLQVSGITANTAIVGWTPGGNETSWEVQYKAQSSSSWQQATAQTPTHTLEGLTPETAYEVKVRAICSTTNMSDFVSTTFTTIGTGIGNVALSNSINLMPNPADNYVELTINSNIVVDEAVIYNAFGQIVQNVQLTDNHARIDLTNMASGMYFVRVSDNNALVTKKFIKR